MSETPAVAATDLPSVLVTGDVCLDVLGIPAPPPAAPVGGAGDERDNWRLTGEIRTFYRRGGVWLLADMVQAATGRRPAQPVALRPAALGGDGTAQLTEAEFERLRREEMIHSLLHLSVVQDKPDDKTSAKVRVDKKHGYSGPEDKSSLNLTLESNLPSVGLVVLGDTGNRFRHESTLWPAALNDGNKPWVIFKLHRPLPVRGKESALWQKVMTAHADRCIVSIEAEDMRLSGANISEGLSWERSALEVVHELRHNACFAVLRDCPRLIVRLGVDGAVLWLPAKEEPCRAILVYDPSGFEGGFTAGVRGDMAGFGSAFTAGLVLEVARALQAAPGTVDEPHLLNGMKLGLAAARKLLSTGYLDQAGAKPDKDEGINVHHFSPVYPVTELFDASVEKAAGKFQSVTIPVICGSTVPDRGYWRILTDVLSTQDQRLRAAAIVATNQSKLKKAHFADTMDWEALQALQRVPIGVFGKVRTYDRREIENYRALYMLLGNYLGLRKVERPLSVAVFGPPGSGKSFGVKQVASMLQKSGHAIKDLTFNLSQYDQPEDLAAAFHLVRDLVLKGVTPLVFFDEFDCALGEQKLGWLRSFLAPMQDGEFMDRGSPHPIGKAIFIFAGGTCDSFDTFRAHLGIKPEEFKSAKGPDFLSRLRGVLDISSLNLDSSFDPYGPSADLPCVPAILLRRAGVLAHQLSEKAAGLADEIGVLHVDSHLLRAFLHLPHFEHGNRSLEALLDMSHLQKTGRYTPSCLPPASQMAIHADSRHFSQHLLADYPFPPEDRDRIAKAIHDRYLEDARSGGYFDPKDPAHRDWHDLDADLKDSNREQADDIVSKLRAAGLWFRKPLPNTPPCDYTFEAETLERLAKNEHDRWVADKRRQHWIFGLSKNKLHRTHPCLVKWDDPRLDDGEKNKDRSTVEHLPALLKAGGYEICDAASA